MTSEIPSEDNKTIANAGNSNAAQPHVTGQPYQRSLHEALHNEDIKANLTDEEIKLLDTAGYWEENPAAKELAAAPKSRKGLWIALGTGTAALLVAGGAFLGVSAKGGDQAKNLPPEPTPNASAPVTPGAEVSATPTTAPVVETPTPVETAPAQTGESTGLAAEYNMTDAEYQSLVDSFKISLSANPSPTEAIAAFNDRMTAYFAVGHTIEQQNKYLEWSSPNVSQPGWNSWSTQTASSAIQESMFDVNYNQTVGSYIPKMESLKKQANRLWANASSINHSDDYALTFEFTPSGGGITEINGGFIADGSITYSDNSAQFSATATDSQAISSFTVDGQSVAMAPDRTTDTWKVTRMVAGLPAGK